MNDDKGAGFVHVKQVVLSGIYRLNAFVIQNPWPSEHGKGFTVSSNRRP